MIFKKKLFSLYILFFVIIILYLNSGLFLFSKFDSKWEIYTHLSSSSTKTETETELQTIPTPTSTPTSTPIPTPTPTSTSTPTPTPTQTPTSTSTPTTTQTKTVPSNPISTNYMEGVSNYHKIRFVYEDDIFYRPMVDYYTQMNENSQVYIYIDEPKNNRSMYFSEEFIKIHATEMGYIEKNIQIVYSIEDVPNYSIIFIILPERHPNDPIQYEKSIYSYIGYDNFKSKSYKNLRIFGKVYFFGQFSNFQLFHLGLDEFLTHHKQYRVINHPIQRQTRIIHLVTLSSINPNSKLVNVIKNLEELQFPKSFDCQTQRSLINEYQTSGMFSAHHLSSYRLLLTMFDNRMFIPNQGGFKYGLINDLYLQLSPCDNIKIENKDKREILGIKNNQTDIDLLYATKDTGYKGLLNNYIPPEASSTFVNGYQARSFLLDYMVSPTFSLREFIGKTTRRVFKENYQPRCISIHVRHGDKIKESNIFPFKYYADILQTLLKQQKIEGYNKLNYRAFDEITEIFIMTDDQISINEALEWNKKTMKEKYNIHWVEGVDRMNYQDIAHYAFDPKSDRIDHGMLMHTEAVIASRCELFIGTMSSNVGRAISELQGAQYEFNGKNIKYVSLDMEYYKDLSVVPVYNGLKGYRLIK